MDGHCGSFTAAEALHSDSSARCYSKSWAKLAVVCSPIISAVCLLVVCTSKSDSLWLARCRDVRYDFFFFLSHTRSQLGNILYKRIPRKGVRRLGPRISFYSHLKKTEWECKCWMRHKVISDTCGKWASGLVNGPICNLTVVTQALGETYDSIFLSRLPFQRKAWLNCHALWIHASSFHGAKLLTDKYERGLICHLTGISL